MKQVVTKGVLKSPAGAYPLLETEPVERASWQDHDIFTFLAVVAHRVTKISIHGDFLILHHDPYKKVEVIEMEEDNEVKKQKETVSSMPQTANTND